MRWFALNYGCSLHCYCTTVCDGQWPPHPRERTHSPNGLQNLLLEFGECVDIETLMMVHLCAKTKDQRSKWASVDYPPRNGQVAQSQAFLFLSLFDIGCRDIFGILFSELPASGFNLSIKQSKKNKEKGSKQHWYGMAEIIAQSQT